MLKTSINGKPAPWTREIWKLWSDKAATLPFRDGELVTDCNYHTPRPYRNEYDRGTTDEGFVYTINWRRVAFIRWTALHPSSAAQSIGGPAWDPDTDTEDHWCVNCGTERLCITERLDIRF